MKSNLNVFFWALSIVLAHPEQATTEGSYALENNLFDTFQCYTKLYFLIWAVICY